MATDNIKSRQWLNNAFWENHQKDRVTAILRVVDNRDRVTNQVMTVPKFDEHGNRTRDFHEIVQYLGETQINENTNARHAKKRAEQEERVQREKARSRAKALEKLFDAKIEVLEIPEIQETKNAELKRKLRRAKNVTELNLYAMLIMQEELGISVKPKRKATTRRKAPAKAKPE